MSLFLTINRFNRLYMNELTNILSHYGLTPANWSLLHYLQENEFATASQLATYWQVEKPTVSANIKSLISRKLITAVSGEDKREKKLKLTTAGIDLTVNSTSDVKAFQAKLLEGFVSTEQATQMENAILQMELMIRGIKDE